jgi:AraC family transcriptional regulator of adaptative response/methylated-DNA-[protein]-cysteine methyltransferase
VQSLAPSLSIRLRWQSPANRVIRSNGALSGYRWGVERKRMLLDKEAAA